MYPIGPLDFKSITSWLKEELTLIFLIILIVSFLICSFLSDYGYNSSTPSDRNEIIKTNIIGVYVENINDELGLEEGISISKPTTVKISIESMPGGNPELKIIRIRK